MERILFVVDYRNYKENGTIGKRPSSRGIIIKDNKLGMVYSRKYDYYKFPGGGIDNGETNEEALVREVKEEVGLEVIKSSIKEYGLAIRKEMGKIEDIFVQENYYYFCEVTDNIFDQKLELFFTDFIEILRKNPEYAKKKLVFILTRETNNILMSMVSSEQLILVKEQISFLFKSYKHFCINTDINELDVDALLKEIINI